MRPRDRATAKILCFKRISFFLGSEEKQSSRANRLGAACYKPENEACQANETRALEWNLKENLQNNLEFLGVPEAGEFR
jgi:hypothetical protein